VRSAYPSIGEDIKVMGTRRERQLELTVACAVVGRHVIDLADYGAKKQHVGLLALEAARTVTDAPLSVFVNAADGETPESVYLTVTGLSAEAGDDGQVGRGNRVNGLITPYRPMSLEAAAGKNPITHVGKLYNVMANRVAQAVVADVPEVQDAYCYLLSRIGDPITDPIVRTQSATRGADATAALTPRITASRGRRSHDRFGLATPSTTPFPVVVGQPWNRG
jgi:S-adenosylmethionine synthetase